MHLHSLFNILQTSQRILILQLNFHLKTLNYAKGNKRTTARAIFKFSCQSYAVQHNLPQEVMTEDKHRNKGTTNQQSRGSGIKR